MDPYTHHRRSTRIQGYDYVQAGPYGVTICVRYGRGVLSEIVDGVVFLSDFGCIVEEMWRTIPQRFANVKLDEHSVMPNHVHLILQIVDQVDGVTLGSIMKDFKGRTDDAWQKYRAARNPLQWRGPLWQRGFRDRVIRDENDLERSRKYVRENPMRWSFDELNPRVCSGKFGRFPYARRQ